ncbi:MAG: hypothetical protein AVDCRST_MAG38-2442 [uncultured Solirubrobacteraceae bacterium]|uniref:Uncharacterized protein n=1 Tax=uncultured Solirubrobacteraceae bacterium TaxID=1162706 RepID=A0A6J4S8C7_9ACTN|nr:MAG: hypothetical protein AVDCRST_MAG38-2442 [uncultured Solirubrobacteraceae bacterium]
MRDQATGYRNVASAQTPGAPPASRRGRAARQRPGQRFGARRGGYARGMEYAIPVILVLIIVAAGITAFVMNSQRKTRGGHDAVSADDRHGGGPGAGADDTPLGDTAEHAGPQSRGGETLGEPDATVHGGTGHPVSHYGASVPPERDAGRLGAGTSSDQGVRPGSGERDGVAPKADDRDNGGDGPEAERLADRPV